MTTTNTKNMEDTTVKKKKWECPQVVNIDKELIQLISGPGSDAGAGSTHS